MRKLRQYRVLIVGILSPLMTAFLGIVVYGTLTRASTDRNQDFVLRLTLVTFAMSLPFLLALVLALRDRRQGALKVSGKVGLGIAVLSLGLVWLPLRGLVGRVQQARNGALSDVVAPTFDTVDIVGKSHRLEDHLGKVVLINAWATWCSPCKKEMPQLDQLYQAHKDDGLMVFGLSTEDADLQQKFVREEVAVSYPLLTVGGNVPALYRDIQRWPAIFLIDRKGRLQPAPQAGERFEKIETAVDVLLKE